MSYIKLLIDYGIMTVLLLMSIVSVAVSIERFIYFKKLHVNEFTDKKLLELAITARIYWIASIGSNAPYIGLLGTVMGIIYTFHIMGKNGVMDSSGIMVGLALALKTTAAGLLVAIPSVITYNFLLRRCKELVIRWEIAHDTK